MKTKPIQIQFANTGIDGLDGCRAIELMRSKPRHGRVIVEYQITRSNGRGRFNVGNIVGLEIDDRPMPVISQTLSE